MFHPYSNQEENLSKADPETIFTFTGNELDAETGYSYFGARYYAPATLAAWLSVDPMADKYPGISPYAYCAWNPVKLVDPDGMEIWIICCEKKFQYQPGMSSEGMDGFAKLSVDALNSIYNSGEEGGLLINILSCSNNIFNISKQDDGELSGFQPDNPMGAYCRNNKSIVEHWQEYVDRGKKISSGGEIKWNTDGYNIMTSEGLRNSPAFHLLHELCHAYDANQGTMDETEYLGLSRNEWSACIRSNCIGLSMGYPIQTHYGGELRNGKFVNGVNLLDENNYPINPF